jgi:ATP-dependent helicase/nuclease subunit A
VAFNNIFEELDGEQRQAVKAGSNAVVSAGAGSGKTRVIASRYAWLVMEKGIPVEEILTLTFTNKAVNEMYSRIYAILAAHQDDERARKAVSDFSRANILTLDSFCTGVTRTAARRYGISPDFICDLEGARDLALEAALPFALNHRDNQGLRNILGDKKIKKTAEELFAGTVLSSGSITAPLDLDRLWQKQRDEIQRQWDRLSKAAEEPAAAMISAMGRLEKPGDQIAEILRGGNSFPPAPDIGPLMEGENSGESLRNRIREYFAFFNRFCGIVFSGRLNPEKEIIRDNRDILRELIANLESIAHTALSADTIKAVFSLIDEFQREFNQKKREAGQLTFQDIAHLAVDALSRYPDLRRFYNNSFSAIMIDEFQDNNALQRDLIFLLAEKPECQKPGIPGLEDINPDKMIFVGDEKQSIYRFRGADVSVFRKLSDSFARYYPGGNISLSHNYRSSPALIAAFNRFFGGILSGGKAAGAGGEGGPEPSVFLRDEGNLPDYEARYEGIVSGLKTPPGDGQNPPLHFCFLDKDQMPGDDPYKLSGDDLEAAYIAVKIREITGGADSPYLYGDIAVLLRTMGHQASLEKQFQNFGIPYNTDDPAGLFSDAPINDLFNFLRLLVYPGDKAAYAAFIRSPFCGFSDLVLTVCMLDPGGIPFAEEMESRIPPEELDRFRKARILYQSMAEEARTKPVTELLTRLWYQEAYRYETLWSRSSQIYGELFDFFFELARKSESRGQTLSEFLDDFAEIIKNDERIRELRIPVEREGGVRIMTVHKSKGLEFPVVFIPGCQGKIKIDRGGETVFFSDDWGISLSLPPAEELPNGGGENYFYRLQREEEKQKAAAELRRLLYVAMTRAESRLFLSAVLPPRNKDERESWENEETPPGSAWIKKRLTELEAKKEDSTALPGFLDLLLPVLTAGDDSLFTLETIPPYTRRELSRLYTARRDSPPLSMAKAAEAAAGFYENTPLVPPPGPPALSVNASELHYMPPAGTVPPGGVAPGTGAAPHEGTVSGKAAAEEDPGDIDRILFRAKLEPAEFGTIVHAYLEALIKGGKISIPPKFQARLNETEMAAVDQAARNMAENFLSSDLGRLSLADPNRESEFPILTMVNSGDQTIAVTGIIDLVFESQGAMYVVDFKTDKAEEPERHLGQLAIYRRAVSDIFGKPVRAWIFFLRSGRSEEVSSGAEKVDIEKMIADHIWPPACPDEDA